MFRLQHDLEQLRTTTPERAHLDALHTILPVAPLQPILAAVGRSSRRCSRACDEFVVFFVLALGLFADKSYRAIARYLLPYRRGQQLPGRSTLCMARQRLGVEPFRWLAAEVLRPLADPATVPDAFYKGLRLLAVDGFCLSVPDSPANAAVFDYAANQHGRAGYPSVRLVAVCELATHALLGWQMDAGRVSESVLATPLLEQLPAGTLLLWDRHYFSFDHLSRVRRRGSHLLARLSKTLKPKELCRLSDGSYRAEVRASPRSRLGVGAVQTVRVIHYRLQDPRRDKPGAVQRLLTTLLDEQAYPATELIALYHQRWEEELAIGEVKTRQLQRPVLRSQTPEGVEQEVHGLLLAHYAVRKVMVAASLQAGVPPRRLSFTQALSIVRCRLAERKPSRRPVSRRWYQDLIAEVAQEVLPPRRLRLNPRVKKCPRQKWPAKRKQAAQPPQPVKPLGEVIVVVDPPD